MTSGNSRRKYLAKTMRTKVQRVKTRRKTCIIHTGKGPACVKCAKLVQNLSTVLLFSDQTDHFTEPVFPVPEKHGYISIRQNMKHVLEVRMIVSHSKNRVNQVTALHVKKVGKQKFYMKYLFLSVSIFSLLSPPGSAKQLVSQPVTKIWWPQYFSKKSEIWRGGKVCVHVCVVFMARSGCGEGSGLQQQTASTNKLASGFIGLHEMLWWGCA